MHKRFLTSRFGCYAQYVAHDAEKVIRVPEALPDEALAPLDLAMCVAACLRMLHDMDAIRGRCLGVGGLGAAGLVAVQMAKAEGAGEVIDPRRSRKARMQECACG